MGHRRSQTEEIDITLPWKIETAIWAVGGVAGVGVYVALMGVVVLVTRTLQLPLGGHDTTGTALDVVRPFALVLAIVLAFSSRSAARRWLVRKLTA